METNFADRFFWTRRRSGLGANIIARETGCAQSLVSAIENGGRDSSKYNDKFARLFDVDHEWLRSGKGREPKGFNAAEAHATRTGGGIKRAQAVQLRAVPRYMAESASPESDQDRADALRKTLITDFQSYARLIGPERTKEFLGFLVHLSELVSSAEIPERDP